MGTPMQNLVRRVLSPKTVPQNLFKSPKSPLCNTPTINLQPPSVNHFIRCLNFQNSPNTNFKCIDNDLGINPIYENKNKFDEVKIKITGCNFFENDNFDDALLAENRKIPFFNTPERRKILDFGLSEKKWPVLGRGHFGTVVEGFYQGNIVAVKVISTKTNSLLREKNALTLKHINIVETINVIEEPLKDFGIIFMQYYPKSKNMQVLLDDPNFRLPNDVVLQWALDVSEGLKFCHENRILHLDLKPQNILVGEDHICRLCDFGSSVDLNNYLQTENYSLGTVAYTAPELFKGEKLEFKADIYSLGITFWQMESREIPYKDINNKDIIIYEVVKKKLRPTLPISKTKYSELFEKCWAESPQYRPDINVVIAEIKKMMNQ